jgi:hypothetical protein
VPIEPIQPLDWLGSLKVIFMRGLETKRVCKSSNTTVYDFDSDATAERVIRDPMAVLLGRSSLSLQGENGSTDPYNRVGRFVNSVHR